MTAPIRVERHVAAPPPVVYRFLADPERLSRWLGLDAVLGNEPGGSFTMRSPNGMTASGQVVEVVTDTSISFTWGWEGHPTVPPGSSLVQIELVPDGKGTLVRLTHSGLDIEEHPIHTKGWTHYLARLATAASGADPGPDPGAG